jgi:hypothetical protein
MQYTLIPCSSQLFCTLYYVTFFFTVIKFQTPPQSGVEPASIVTSLITTQTGCYRWSI